MKLPYYTKNMAPNGNITIPIQYREDLGVINGGSFKIRCDKWKKTITLELL